jgi:hypothetical protein
MRITSGSIIGLGTGNVLSWYNSGYTALQVGGMSGIFSNTSNTSTTGALTFAYNIYVDSAGNYQYMNTTNARAGSTILMDGGNISFSNVAAATSANPTLITRLTIASTGAATFSAATGASTLTINGAANQWTSTIIGNSTTSQSFGLLLTAGTNSTDGALRVRNQANTLDWLFVRGDGNVGIGTISPGALLEINGGSIKHYLNNETCAINHQGTMTVANGGTKSINVTNGGLIFISENNTGDGALFFCGYKSATVVVIADPNGRYAGTNTAGKACLYKSANNGTATFINNLGSSLSFTIYAITNSD